MLCIAAALFHKPGMTDMCDLGPIHAHLGTLVGGGAALAFGIALMASGLSSSSVGTYAGQIVMAGFMNWLYRVQIAGHYCTNQAALWHLHSRSCSARRVPLRRELLTLSLADSVEERRFGGRVLAGEQVADRSVWVDDVCHVGVLDVVADVGSLRERVGSLGAVFAAGDLPVRDVVLITHHALDLPRRTRQEVPVGFGSRGSDAAPYCSRNAASCLGPAPPGSTLKVTNSTLPPTLSAARAC
jgi:natural resistance-associated macrophage protein